MILFKEDTHQYFSNDRELISTTQLMRKHGLAPDYSMVNIEVLNRKAQKGSYVHKEIELYIKNGDIGFTDELQLFINKLNELDRKVLYSEKLVCNDIVAGTIDLVFENKIADIKNTYQLHKEPVSWQTSIYAYLYDKEHYNDYSCECWWFNNGELKVVEIERKPIELIECLMNCERNGELFDLNKYRNIQLINDLVGYMKAIKELQLKVDEIKSVLNSEIKQYGNFKNDDITISYTQPSSSYKFDEDLFKQDNPEMWEKYKKETTRKESITYKLK